MSVRLQQVLISVPFPTFILEIGRCVLVVVKIPYYLFEGNFSTTPDLLRIVIAWVAIGFIITSTAYFWLMQQKYDWVEGVNGYPYFIEKQKNQTLPNNARVIFVERCKLSQHGCVWFDEAKVITTGDDL